MTPGTPNSSLTTSIFELMTHITPISSPFLFIQSLYALLFLSVGFLIHLSPLIFMLSWKRLLQMINFISMNATVKSDERKVPEATFVGGCHGNDYIHTRTKFHLHVCYTEQVIGVKKSKALFCWWLPWKQLNTHAYQVSPPCVLY